MCERYTIVAEAEKINNRFNVEVPEIYKPSYNAAPSQLLPVITNANPNEISYFHWGLVPGWAKNKSISTKIINTPSEAIEEKASFRNALKQRRCLIIADGYYDWKQSFKKSKIPYRVLLKTEGLFAFAGLWEAYEDENNNTVHTFTIITTAANGIISKINERMPVILADQESERSWLNNNHTMEEQLTLLQPYDEHAMDLYTISPLVNSIQNNSPKLIQPTPPVDQFGNLTLFD